MNKNLLKHNYRHLFITINILKFKQKNIVKKL